MRAMVVSATSTDSSSGSSWIPFGKRRFSITTASSPVSVLYSNTLTGRRTSRSSQSYEIAESCFCFFLTPATLPSVCGGLHDELQVVSALPLTAGGGEIHLLSILSHRQVIDEGHFSACDHLTSRHQPGGFACTQERLRTSWTAEDGVSLVTHLWWG